MSSYSGFADSYSPGTTTTNPGSTSTIRPRRLISYTDDDEDNNGRQLLSTGLSTASSSGPPTIRSRGATPSPRPSRAVSPIPMSHPSRINQTSNPRAGNTLGGFSLDAKDQAALAKQSRAAIDFLDASWTSLQSLASSVLGSDITHPVTNGTRRTHVRKPSRPEASMRMPSRTLTSSTWGPSGPTIPEFGAGTKEERLALLQAKKREALLLAETDPAWSRNPLHKRRDSNDQASASAMMSEQDEEALVYVHQVQPTDSITSVTIRYGCQPAVFRKANGFWPSDNIQGRKTVLLPVDCCSVKGRPVQVSQNTNLLDDEPRRLSIEDPSGSSIVPMSRPKAPALSGSETPAETGSENESDQMWKHETWVHIDGFSEHVEIGRVPRRALGFFPRTRRKSVCYTDSETSLSGRERAPSIYSTLSPTIQPDSPDSPSVPQNRPYADLSEPQNAAGYKPATRHKRQRSGLELSGTGVGTLDRSVMAPGPALDGLSKFFARLPGLPSEQPSQNADGENAYPSTNTSSNATSLDSIGGAVEGWVRKMTTRAKTSFNDFQQGTANSSRGPTSRRRWLDDLIELDDGLESTNSSGLLAGPGWNADFNRSGSSLHSRANLRERFPSSSPSTSRTRLGPDRVKDD